MRDNISLPDCHTVTLQVPDAVGKTNSGDFCRAVWERRKIPLLCLSAFLLAGIVYHLASPTYFESRAHLIVSLVDGESGPAPADDPWYSGHLLSDAVLERTIRTLQAEVSPSQDAEVSLSEIESLRANLDVTNPRKTPHDLRLAYRSTDAHSVQQTLECVIESYVECLKTNSQLGVQQVAGKAGSSPAKLRAGARNAVLSGQPTAGGRLNQSLKNRLEKFLTRSSIWSSDVETALPAKVDVVRGSSVAAPVPAAGDQQAGVEAKATADEQPSVNEGPAGEAASASPKLETLGAAMEASIAFDRQRELLLDIYEALEPAKPTMIQVTVLRRPTAAEAASPVRLWLVLASCSMIGITLGLGGVYVAEQFDQRVRSPEEMETLLEGQIIGAIPSAANRDCRLKLQASGGTDLEAMQTVRLAVEFGRLESQAFVVAGTSEGELAARSVLALGTAFAESGQRTLLIDADLKDQCLSKLIAPDARQGFVDLLRVGASVAEAASGAVQMVVRDNLHALAAGPHVNSTLQRMTARRCTELLLWARGEYDRVLIATASASDRLEAAVLGRLTDGIVLLVNSSQPRRNDLDVSAARLKRFDCRVLGILVERPEPATERGILSLRNSLERDDAAASRDSNHSGDRPSRNAA